ncbi:uncharacterized protein LOC132724689 [Ruditapes philippinarum]|uniref:uncharacterized protein LOC132724689 n=1 Tax=Ruditapes philippinarum TaxID=129788 RepID=UPI00295B995A|nr:uncharacterized protein LOC132724689 [Ruditapes philippinarum]
MEDLLNLLESYLFIAFKHISFTTVLIVLACILHYFNMRQAVTFVLPFILMSTFCSEEGRGEEKVAFIGESRFEYKYKVLQKLVQLEEGQSKLELKLKEKSNIIEHLTEELKEPHASIEALNDVIDKMEEEGPGQGETYVRWGRTTCPDNGAELVYDGYTAGSHFTHSGAAVNYLCLPKKTSWAKYNDGVQEYRGYVFGAEYEGVLVAGYYKHTAASEYVCLDESPESIEGSNADQNGILMYSVEGRCGSLKCPPYIDGRELSCVVCSYTSYQRTRGNQNRHWTSGK